MKRKKFFITTTVPGTLSFFRDQCKALQTTFDVCAVSSPDERLTSFASQEGIRFKALMMKRDISLIWDLIALFRWMYLLLCERPYVVHANTPKASLLATFAAWLTFRPVRIYMCHGLRYQGCSGFKRHLLISMEKITCFCANRVLCVSEGVREQLAKDGICSLNKSQVILYGSANGIDIDYFHPNLVDEEQVRTRYDLHTDDYVCVFIGRLVRDKGVEELIDAVVKLHENQIPVKLLMVGGREEQLDALASHTERQIKENDYIIECGRQTDVRPFIKASHILTLPSYREGFGQVLVEANAMGKPVIASRIVGCKSVVTEGVNGLLCEPHDVLSLYENMNRLYTDKGLYQSIQGQCRSYVIQRYEHRKVLSAYVRYYESLN